MSATSLQIDCLVDCLIVAKDAAAKACEDMKKPGSGPEQGQAADRYLVETARANAFRHCLDVLGYYADGGAYPDDRCS